MPGARKLAQVERMQPLGAWKAQIVARMIDQTHHNGIKYARFAADWSPGPVADGSPACWERPDLFAGLAVDPLARRRRDSTDGGHRFASSETRRRRAGDRRFALARPGLGWG